MTISLHGDRDALYCAGRARAYARGLGFDGRGAERIALAVSELVNNVIRYAGRGTLRLCRLSSPGPGIEVVVEDEGPGIEDIEAVLAGRVPRSPVPPGDRGANGGLGYGLGTVRRLMDDLSVENRPEGGLRVCTRKWLAPASARPG